MAYGVKNKKSQITKTLIIIGAVTICVVFSVHWVSIENFRKNFFPTKKSYFEVTLLNRCLLHERYFSVEVLGKEEKYDFQNSKSRVFANKGNKVRLSIDRKYLKYFHLQNYKYIEQEMLLIAECSFDTSIQKVMTSIRSTFSRD